jgi:hypothetical protein
MVSSLPHGRRSLPAMVPKSSVDGAEDVAALVRSAQTDAKPMHVQVTGSTVEPTGGCSAELSAGKPPTPRATPAVSPCETSFASSHDRVRRRDIHLPPNTTTKRPAMADTTSRRPIVLGIDRSGHSEKGP